MVGRRAEPAASEEGTRGTESTVGLTFDAAKRKLKRGGWTVGRVTKTLLLNQVKKAAIN